MDRALATAGLAGLADLRDRMCACTSAACAAPLYDEQVSLDLTLQAVRRRDPAVQEAWMAIADQARRCLESRR